MNAKIIVPIDFTRASGKAVKQAIAIAKRAGSPVTLFHVIGDETVSAAEVNEKMNTEVDNLRQFAGITCEVLIKKGNVLDIIANTVREKAFDLMVVGTQAFSGIRQMIFGTDIVKLMAMVPVPVLVVQEESSVVDVFHKIVLPVSDHDNFRKAVEAVLLFTGIFDIEVHFYSIHKRGFEMSNQMLVNIEETAQTFKEKGIQMVRIKEEPDDYSSGGEKQTLRYARSIGADTLWIMSVASQESHYMAKAYKEVMALNEDHLLMLCTGGGGVA